MDFDVTKYILQPFVLLFSIGFKVPVTFRQIIDGLRKAGDAPGHKIVVAVCVCVFVVVVVVVGS